MAKICFARNIKSICGCAMVKHCLTITTTYASRPFNPILVDDLLTTIPYLSSLRVLLIVIISGFFVLAGFVGSNTHNILFEFSA